MNCKSCPKLNENIAELKSTVLANGVEINDMQRKNGRERFKQKVLTIEHQLEKNEFKRQIDAKNAEIAQMKAVQQDKQSEPPETASSIDEMKKQFNEQVRKLQSEFETFKAEKASEKAQLKAMEQKQLEQHTVSIGEMKKQFNEQVRKLQSEIESFKAEKAQLKAVEQKQSEQHASIDRMKKQFNDQMQKFKSEIGELKKQIAEMNVDSRVNIDKQKREPKRLMETIKGVESERNVPKANVVKEKVTSETAGRKNVKRTKNDENLPLVSQSKEPVDNDQHKVITRSMAKALANRNK